MKRLVRRGRPAPVRVPVSPDDAYVAGQLALGRDVSEYRPDVRAAWERYRDAERADDDGDPELARAIMAELREMPGGDAVLRRVLPLNVRREIRDPLWLARHPFRDWRRAAYPGARIEADPAAEAQVRSRLL